VPLDDRDWIRERPIPWSTRSRVELGRGRPGRGQRSLFGRRSRVRWLVVLAVLIVGVFVLPHVAIDGRHWRFFIF
jgi:hypothetical protein